MIKFEIFVLQYNYERDALHLTWSFVNLVHLFLDNFCLNCFPWRTLGVKTFGEKVCKRLRGNWIDLSVPYLTIPGIHNRKFQTTRGLSVSTSQFICPLLQPLLFNWLSVWFVCITGNEAATSECSHRPPWNFHTAARTWGFSLHSQFSCPWLQL